MTRASTQEQERRGFDPRLRAFCQDYGISPEALSAALAGLPAAAVELWIDVTAAPRGRLDDCHWRERPTFLVVSDCVGRAIAHQCIEEDRQRLPKQAVRGE